MNNSQNSLNVFSGDKGKDKKFRAQMRLVLASFGQQPKTMLMAAVETGVLRANICRYVAQWKKNGKIKVVKNDRCEVSKCKADYYYSGNESPLDSLKDSKGGKS